MEVQDQDAFKVSLVGRVLYTWFVDGYLLIVPSLGFSEYTEREGFLLSLPLLTRTKSYWIKFLTSWPCWSLQFSSVQSLSRVRLFSTPWIAARQASLSITNSRSSLRLTSIESVMLPSHLILGRPLLLLPSIPPSIKVFSSESTLHMRRPKYWSFSFSIILSKEIPGLISLDD